MVKILKKPLIKPAISELAAANENRILQSLRQQAYQEGLTQGLEEARLKGEVALQQQCQKYSEQIQELLSSIPIAVDAFLKENQGLLVDILSMILPAFFTQYSLHKENIEHSIHRAIKEVSNQQSLKVYLSAEDAKLLQDKRLHLNLPEGIHIEVSPQVQLGGCLVATEKGIFDGRLESQIEALKHHLLEYKQKICA